MTEPDETLIYVLIDSLCCLFTLRREKLDSPTLPVGGSSARGLKPFKVHQTKESNMIVGLKGQMWSSAIKGTAEVDFGWPDWEGVTETTGGGLALQL
jgi:hypothetical protein